MNDEQAQAKSEVIPSDRTLTDPGSVVRRPYSSR